MPLSSSETFAKRPSIFLPVRKTVNSQGYSELWEPIKTREKLLSTDLANTNQSYPEETNWTVSMQKLYCATEDKKYQWGHLVIIFKLGLGIWASLATGYWQLLPKVKVFTQTLAQRGWGYNLISTSSCRTERTWRWHAVDPIEMTRIFVNRWRWPWCH